MRSEVSPSLNYGKEDAQLVWAERASLTSPFLVNQKDEKIRTLDGKAVLLARKQEPETGQKETDNGTCVKVIISKDLEAQLDLVWRKRHALIDNRHTAVLAEDRTLDLELWKLIERTLYTLAENEGNIPKEGDYLREWPLLVRPMWEIIMNNHNAGRRWSIGWPGAGSVTGANGERLSKYVGRRRSKLERDDYSDKESLSSSSEDELSEEEAEQLLTREDSIEPDYGGRNPLNARTDFFKNEAYANDISVGNNNSEATLEVDRSALSHYERDVLKAAVAALKPISVIGGLSLQHRNTVLNVISGVSEVIDASLSSEMSVSSRRATRSAKRITGSAYTTSSRRVRKKDRNGLNVENTDKVSKLEQRAALTAHSASGYQIQNRSRGVEFVIPYQHPGAAGSLMTDTPLKERKDTLGLTCWVRELRTLFSKNASSAEVRRWLLRLRKEVAEHENHDAEGVTLQLFGDLTDLAVSRGLLPVISTYFIDNIAYRFYPKDEVRENRARRDARTARNRAGRGAHLGCSYSKS